MIDSGIWEKFIASKGMKTFLETYNASVGLFLAICTVLVIMMVIFHIVKIALNASNPKERSDAIKNLWTVSICFSLIGSIDIVYSLLVRMILGQLN